MAIQSFWEDRGLYLRMIETVTTQDLIDSTLKSTGDERVDEIRYIVNDWSDVQKVEIELDNISHIISFCKVEAKTNDRISKAIVLPSKGEYKSLFDEMLRQMNEQLPWRVKLFSTEEQGREWLIQELKFDLPASPKTNPKFLNEHTNTQKYNQQ